jgi:hypothetical protein
MKKIQIGVRVNAEDAEFLNLLEINGATTPSDKLRAIIEEARLRREFSNEYTGSYRMIQEQITPIIEKIKNAEFEKGIHSALLTRILEWMPDFYAYCLSSRVHEDGPEAELINYERGAVDRVVRLLESLLHLQLSEQENCYSPDLLKKHVNSLADVIKIIDTTSQKKEG